LRSWFGAPASSAGLPARKAMVCVGPPLSCSGPSSGSTLSRSVVSKPLPPVVLPTRLWPCERSLPERSGAVAAVLPARMVLSKVSVARLRMPPPSTMPPPSSAELPLGGRAAARLNAAAGGAAVAAAGAVGQREGVAAVRNAAAGAAAVAADGAVGQRERAAAPDAAARLGGVAADGAVGQRGRVSIVN